jgi:hypothetical protein
MPGPTAGTPRSGATRRRPGRDHEAGLRRADEGRTRSSQPGWRRRPRVQPPRYCPMASRPIGNARWRARIGHTRSAVTGSSDAVAGVSIQAAHSRLRCAPRVAPGNPRVLVHCERERATFHAAGRPHSCGGSAANPMATDTGRAAGTARGSGSNRTVGCAQHDAVRVGRWIRGDGRVCGSGAGWARCAVAGPGPPSRRL